jgi:HSP90 family molecular chaperone
LDALSTVIFTDPQDVLRELLTNAQDACILRRVQDPDFTTPQIAVSGDAPASVLAFRVRRTTEPQLSNDWEYQFRSLESDR